MIIQKILFPRPEICDEKEMYFREGEVLSFGTYFNAFSIGKWKNYTRLDNLTLRLEYEGEAEIIGYHALGNREIEGTLDSGRKQNSICRDCVIREVAIETQRIADGCVVRFTELPEDGILYVTLRDCGGFQFHGGAYETTCSEMNSVYLALGICTFQREPFVQRNVNAIIEQIIENTESPLYEHVEVYIADNGQTLSKDLFVNQKIHLFPNKNAGGAGGFTRDLIEAFFRRENSPFTHMILMDDDIILDCEVLERTYHFLQLVREEYQDMMLGGGLLELDKRFLQFEAGAAFRGMKIHEFNQNWDMRKLECVVANEIENHVDFNGWWYCCIPKEYVREDNLPLPVFIHWDDVEYGARDPKDTILMNGICVWHPQGPNKAPVSMNYYDIRNNLIAACGLPEGATKEMLIRIITELFLGYILRYRYKAIDCVLYAADEFLKGPEFFMDIEPVANHKEISRFNYSMVTPEEAGVDLAEIKYESSKGLGVGVYIRALLSSWLLPAKNTTRVSGTGDIGCAFRAKRVYLYDEEKQLGFITEKSYKEAFRLVMEYFRICKRIRKEFDACMERWSKKKPFYTSREFWETYLELDRAMGKE